jgi:4-azaleucine resistance transporter AzlC
VLGYLKEKFAIMDAFDESLPVMVGYIPFGITFGLLFSEIDVHWFWAVVMTAVVYSGAIQLLIIPLLLDGVSLFDIAFITLLVNFRHIFYGLSLIEKYSQFGFIKKNFMIFGLTDEVYSILTTNPKAERPSFMFSLTILSYLYFIIGTAIGAYAGHFISYDLTFLSFSLIAMFIVLTIEQARKVNSIQPFICAIVSCVLAISMLPNSMPLTALIVAVTYFGVVYKYGKL